MIKKVHAKNMKGRNFDQTLGQYNFVVGPNESGKSARTDAILLAILGYVPTEKPRRKNGDILEGHGSGDTLYAGITFETPSGDGRLVQHRIDRCWKRGGNGTVSQIQLVDRRRPRKREPQFGDVLAKTPAVIDLSEFLKLSDSRKIDLLFSLSPSAGDITDIDRDIEKVKANRDQATRDLRRYEGMIETLREDMPEAPKVSKEVLLGQIAEKKERRAALKDKLAEVKRWEAPPQQTKRPVTSRAPSGQPTAVRAPDDAVQKSIAEGYLEPSDDRPAQIHLDHNAPPSAADIVRRIIDTMDAAGCNTCAAKLVAKRAIVQIRNGGVQ